MAGSLEKSLESHRHLLGDVDAQRVALDKSVALAEVMGTIKVPDIAHHLGGAVSLAPSSAVTTGRGGGMT